MEDNQIVSTEPVLTRREKRALKKQKKALTKSSSANRFNIIVGVVLLLVAGLIVFAVQSSNEQHNNIVAPPINATTESDHVKGNPDAKVVLVEYSDFQCPACAGTYPILKAAAAEFSNDVKFVYRHYPLKAIHPNAEEAAWAAEAAGKQGKFWEMHDMLFDKQNSWANGTGVKSDLRDYASALGLDVAKWEADYESDAVRQKVLADIKSGDAARVSGTPSLFINGTQITNPRSLDELRSILGMEVGIAKGEVTPAQ